MRNEEKDTSGKYGMVYIIVGMPTLPREYIYPNGISVRINICSELNFLVSILTSPEKPK